MLTIFGFVCVDHFVFARKWELSYKLAETLEVRLEFPKILCYVDWSTIPDFSMDSIENDEA